MFKISSYCWLVVMFAAVGRAYSQDTSLILNDATVASGLVFEHHDGTGNEYLFELMSAGLATFDYDNDGRCDIYLLNGANLSGQRPDAATAPEPPGNAMWKQIDDGRTEGPPRFCNVSQATGLNDLGYSLGVVTADYDNDGFIDVYVSNFGENTLFHNNGDGTFSQVTDIAQVASGEKFGAGVVFVDIDVDGDVDLFVGNYVQFSVARHAQLAPAAFPFPPGPKDYPPEPDTLFRNEGNGTFVDISRESGVASVAGPSMGAVASDFDLDGDQDVFVCCDGAPDHFFVNDGHGNFVEDGVLVGVAYDARGNANGSMGADVGDINGDGVEDLLVTDYADQWPMLFVSQSGGFFQDEALKWDLDSLYRHVNWGVGLADFDNDADLDVLVANGHFLKETRETNPQTAFAVANTLLENKGSAFRECLPLNQRSGVQPASSRGVALEDFDRDGDVDAVVLNCAAAAQFLENPLNGPPRTTPQNHWLAIELVGRKSNRSAVGARVQLSGPELAASSQIHAGRGYQSDFGRILHFGLGQLSLIHEITITWPGGGIQKLSGVAADQQLTVVEKP